MNERIIKFIEGQTCGSCCCVDEAGRPYCFSFFYAFNSRDGLLYYKSSGGSAHERILKGNPAVAGTILPDKLNFLKIRGVQFEGELLPADHPLAAHAHEGYYRKHPVGRTMKGDIRTIQLNNIKYTDNTLGFGSKLNWSRNEETVTLREN